jgi:glyoxylase-like metal-dependent hydrolase (beta-lactamase superfamily II)
MVRMEQVCGNTGCLFLKGNCVPFYKISEKKWVLMDSGASFAREELSAYLKEHAIQVRAVLCSHAHYDHTENNRYLQECYGAEIIMSAHDAGVCQNAVALKSCFYSYTVQDIKKFVPEMQCRADRILPPGQTTVEIEDAVFGILPLPGHAASHLGFVTPDGAAYLADSIFNQKVLQAGWAVYMLNWSEALHTLEKIKNFQFQKYILAHRGIYDDVKEMADENINEFKKSLEEFRKLIRKEISLEELVKQARVIYNIPVTTYQQACLIERLVRSAADYLVEEKKISRTVCDGIFVYRPVSQ